MPEGGMVGSSGVWVHSRDPRGARPVSGGYCSEKDNGGQCADLPSEGAGNEVDEDVLCPVSLKRL